MKFEYMKMFYPERFFDNSLCEKYYEYNLTFHHDSFDEKYVIPDNLVDKLPDFINQLLKIGGSDV